MHEHCTRSNYRGQSNAGQSNWFSARYRPRACIHVSIYLSLSLHSRVSPSIFNTCSIMRVLAQIEGWSRLMMKIRVQLLHAHLSCYPSIYMCLFVFRLGSSSYITIKRNNRFFPFICFIFIRKNIWEGILLIVVSKILIFLRPKS